MKGRVAVVNLVLVIVLLCASLPLVCAAQPQEIVRQASKGSQVTGWAFLHGWSPNVSYHQHKEGFPPGYGYYTVIHCLRGSGVVVSFGPVRFSPVLLGGTDIWVPEGYYFGFVRPHRFHVVFFWF